MKLFREKNKIIKVCIIALVLLVFITNFDVSYAAINKSAEDPSLFSKVLAWVIDKIGMGLLSAVIAPAINVMGLLLLLILYILFCGVGLGGFPWPDEIIYNKIAMLDPNFINPAEHSIAKLAQGILAKTYSSLFILATTIFTIAALVIGIKLVFSSIAAEKAKYKELLNTWILGIVMMFLAHYLLAGMFYLNEKIVESVSVVGDNVEVTVNILECVPFLGSTVGKAVSGILSSVTGFINDVAGEDLLDEPGSITLKGYGGIIWRFFLMGIGGDAISSITFLIIIGQTVGLVITYLKRAFTCMFMGILAPLIVAVDVIQKALK